jgi:hypothetical protein
MRRACMNVMPKGGIYLNQIKQIYFYIFLPHGTSLNCIHVFFRGKFWATSCNVLYISKFIITLTLFGWSSAFARKTQLFSGAFMTVYMQCFQFNKRHNELLGTSKFGHQLQFKWFRILIMLISTMFHREKQLKTWYQKVRTDNSA